MTRVLNLRGERGTLLWMLPDDADAQAASPAAAGAAPTADAGPATRARDAGRDAMSKLRDANRETLVLLHREQRARHALERAEGAKAHFFTVLSHELRTPLQAIVGYTELLARELGTSLTSTQREFLRRIEQSEQHLLSLVSNVLDFERMTRGTPMRMEMGPVPVREVLEVIAVMASTLAAEKGLTLDVEWAEPDLVALGDRAMVQQVLVNLLTNAVKFTPTGGHIEVSATRADERVVISVCDTGRGVPAEKLEHIFEPFVQVADADTRHGSGLGLAISRNIARALGGDLVAESEPGKGARFVLTLTAARPSTVRPTIRPQE